MTNNKSISNHLQTLIEEIKTNILIDDEKAIIELLQDKYIPDISQSLEFLSIDDNKYLLGLFSDEFCAKIFVHYSKEMQNTIVGVFEPKNISKWIDHIESDDAVDILNNQPIRYREEIISFIKDSEKSNYILHLLHYEENCAGGIMAKESVNINVNLTVEDSIIYVKSHFKESDKLSYIYIIDDNEKLIGKISLKTLFFSSKETKIKHIYDSNLLSVQPYTSLVEVSEIMKRYDLEVLPVVDNKQKIMGLITIDDVVDFISEESEREQQLMSGLSEEIEENSSIIFECRSKLPWLVIGMAGGILGAQFISLFEEQFLIIPAIVFFIPLITATSGNIGIQSSTIIIQSLGHNRISNFTFLKKKILRSVVSSIINGIILAFISYIFTLYIIDSRMGFIVSISILCVTILSSLIGLLIPIILSYCRINPILATGPFITTLSDLTGIMIYFMAVRLLIV